MSPLEILAKKISQPVFVRPAANASTKPVEVLTAEARLVSIQEEIEALPEVDREARPRRNVLTSLRRFMPLDAVALLWGFVAAFGLSSFVNNFLFARDIEISPIIDSMRLFEYLFVCAGVLLWFEHTGHYRTRMPFWIEVHAVVMTFGAAMIVDGFMQFAAKQDISRLWLISSWSFSAVLILVLRALARHAMARMGVWHVRTLLIGGGRIAEDARVALSSEEGLGYEIVAQVENLPAVLLKSGSSWETLCRRFDADYIVLALEGRELGEAEHAISQLSREDIPFSVVPPLRHVPVAGMVPHYFLNHNVMFLARRGGLDQPLPRFVKRSMDVVVSSLALLSMSPALLILAALVKKDGGPVFYGDRRVGLNGRIFNCYKFRSMVVESDTILKRYLSENPEIRAEWNEYRKLRCGDPRVTTVGKFMRGLSIDELPQLINVLKGDMSLVGPRPIMVVEAETYNRDIAHYYRVRPGITGLWQVSGRNQVTFARRVEMDTWYVRNWSLWHDIAIMFKTIPVLLKKTGAY